MESPCVMEYAEKIWFALRSASTSLGECNTWTTRACFTGEHHDNVFQYDIFEWWNFDGDNVWILILIMNHVCPDVCNSVDSWLQLPDDKTIVMWQLMIKLHRDLTSKNVFIRKEENIAGGLVLSCNVNFSTRLSLSFILWPLCGSSRSSRQQRIIASMYKVLLSPTISTFVKRQS